MENPGAVYHLMNRGNRGAGSFLDDAARLDFLKTHAEARRKTGWQAPANCWMRNRSHLVAGMRWRRRACTLRLNHWLKAATNPVEQPRLITQ